ncbi:MAG: hypothetical protein M1816_001940 [Peltula sp. TS41687]|nr:MAG: hypothetical protein M1816_001940 [Peltula sp. TS41687]
MSQLYQKPREPNLVDDRPVEPEPLRKDERSPHRGSPSRKAKSSLSAPSIDVRLSRRKPAPSPLQTVQSSTSLTVVPDAISTDSNSLLFPRPPTNRPPSIPASYDQGPDSPEHASAADEQSKRSLEEKNSQDGRKDVARPSTPVREAHNEQASGVMEASPFSTPSDRASGASPPGRYSKMVTSALSHHSDAWTEVRKSSIDSAISSIFSQASSSRKSSQDSMTTSFADIANLSSAAGSPEAAIQYLLKEKHQSASQNAQLWRLVDKQRTMILGLNKDLERALHDKERYRKKLKEHLGRQAEVSNVKPQERAVPESQPEDLFPIGSRSHEGSLEKCEADEPSTRPAKEVIRSTHGLTPPASRESSASELDGAFRRDRSGTIARSTESARMVAAPLSPQDSESAGETRTLSPEEPSPTSQKEDDASWRHGTAGKQSMDSVRQPSGTPAFILSEPSPVSEQTPGPTLSSRKAPPAPLNLGLAKPATVRLQPLGPDDHSGSEYDDGPDVNHIRTFERGRRRTREDDDRVREVIALQEQERRSRSNKVTSGSGKSTHKVSEQQVVLVHSPEQLSLDDSHIHQNSESRSIQLPHVELLSPLPLAPRHLQQDGTSGSTTPRALAPSPLSPGLPMSPRPTDRPMNSPRPRLPKENAGLASIASPLLSPAIGIPGLPVSPRALKQGLSFPPRSPMPLTSPRMPKSVASTSSSESGSSPPLAGSQKRAERKEIEVEVRESESPTSTEPSGNNSSYLLGSDERAKKEGYLKKRGKNFGGWKTRFFSLDGPKLRYYETPGGPHLGTIRLRNAQIGKRSEQQSNHSPFRANDNEVEREHRYGFSILEPKKKDSSSYVRHYLCAENGSERDEWVMALLHYVDDSGSENEHPLTVPKKVANDRKDRSCENGMKYSFDKESPTISQDGGSLLGLSYEDTVQAEAPIRGNSSRSVESPPSPSISQSSGSVQRSQISGPTNGVVIQNLEAWGHKPQTLSLADKKEQKKRSIWGFKSRVSSDLNTLLQSSHSSTSNLAPSHHLGRNGSYKAVFGAPLAEATESSQPVGVDVYLPAVVYRCIEYLDAKEAAKEEGIFRLSGSSLVIKGLREKFNNEGDVNFLVEDKDYDVHAVASLLKMYLRELPASVLTRELHLDFLHVIELDSKEKKVDALRLLVHRLPRANHSLLRALSAFLITIVDNSDINKMTVRNVGIVFSPTLNIPAPVLSMFLTEFGTIFGRDLEETTPGNLASVEISVPAPTTSSSTEIRSPRRQMFQDLPTPGHNQSSFPKSPRSINPPSQLPGFAPIPTAHEQPRFVGGQEYGSLNGALAPNHVRDNLKAKRRESSMFLQPSYRTHSATRAHDTPDIVEEETSPV